MPKANHNTFTPQLCDFTRPTPMVVRAIDTHNKTRGSFKILDVGTGTGRNALYAARQGHSVTAIDELEPRQLRTTAEREGLPIEIVVAKLEEFEPKEQFDVVLCLMVLHFLPADSITGAVERLQRWTKPGGLNLVSGFTNENPAGTRSYLFAPDELKRLYRSWEVIEYDESLTPPTLARGETEPRQYMAARLMARAPAAT